MSVNNDNFLIEQSDLDFAQGLCKYIDDKMVRSRAVSNVLSAVLAEKYFENVNVDIKSGIYNVPNVLAELDVSDIYINGNHIEVRLYFDENEMCIPKQHFDLEIAPVAYMFINVQDGLNSALVTGFVLSEDIDKDNLIDDYYFISESQLRSFYDIETRLTAIDDLDLPFDFAKQAFNYLDGLLTDKKLFFNSLFESRVAREYLITAASVKNLISVADLSTVSKDESSLPATSNVQLDVQEDTKQSFVPEMIEYTSVSMLDVSAKNMEMLVSNPENVTPILDEVSSEGIVMRDDGELPILPVYSATQAVVENKVVTDSTSSENELPQLTIETSDEELFEQNESDSELSLSVEDESSDDFSLESFEVADELVEDSVDEQNELLIDADETESIDEPLKESLQMDINADNIGLVKPLEEMSNSSDDADTQISEEIVYSESPESIEDLSEYDYSTSVTPSLSEVDLNESENVVEEYDLEQELENEDNITPSEELETSNAENTYSEYIDDLYQDEESAPYENEVSSDSEQIVSKRGPNGLIIGLLVILLLVFGSIGLGKFFSASKDSAFEKITKTENNQKRPVTPKPKQEEVAMPIETVENVKNINDSEESVNPDISTTGPSLNSTVALSNISINWEVPDSYTTNNTARRYFVKLGKIIQLHLKTALLVQSKTPLNNKITVEVEYNDSNHKFSVKKMIMPSGDSEIDKIITDIVNSVLSKDLNINMSIFGNLKGNPILIINL